MTDERLKIIGDMLEPFFERVHRAEQERDEAFDDITRKIKDRGICAVCENAFDAYCTCLSCNGHDLFRLKKMYEVEKMTTEQIQKMTDKYLEILHSMSKEEFDAEIEKAKKETRWSGLNDREESKMTDEQIRKFRRED